MSEEEQGALAGEGAAPGPGVPHTVEENPQIRYVGTINPFAAGPDELPPGADAGDWMRGLVDWPYPEIDNAEDMRARIMEQGSTPEAFKRTLLYNRWVARLPWLEDV